MGSALCGEKPTRKVGANSLSNSDKQVDFPADRERNSFSHKSGETGYFLESENVVIFQSRRLRCDNNADSRHRTVREYAAGFSHRKRLLSFLCKVNSRTNLSTPF